MNKLTAFFLILLRLAIGWHFFAEGMMLNVLASMQINDNPEPWMTDMLEGCGKEL